MQYATVKLILLKMFFFSDLYQNNRLLQIIKNMVVILTVSEICFLAES